MTCPAPLTLSRYVDHALSGDEALALQSHLDGCPACRTAVDRLTGENLALRTALTTVEVQVPSFVHTPSVSPLLTGLGWSALAVCLWNIVSMGLSALPTLPRWLDWVMPDTTRLGIDLGIGLFKQLLIGSGDLLSGVVQAVAAITLAIFGVIAIGWLSRRRGHPPASSCLSFSLCLFTATLLGGIAPDSQAFELRRDEHRVTIGADEIIDDSLIVTAETIVVDGTVTGDLIVLGEQVSVRGYVGGSLIGVAETLSIEGEVAGNVLGIGETVDIRGAPLAANLYGIGRAVTVHADTEVAGNVLLAAAEAEAQGTVGRDLLAAAQHFTLSGRVNGDLQSYAEQIDLTTTATVGGDFIGKVKSQDDLKLASGASVAGTTSVDSWPEQPNRYLTFDYYLGQTLQLLAALVTGLVLLHFVPALRRTRLDGGAEVLTTLGIGAAALIATPAMALIVTLTLIGAPLGIMAFLLWLTALYAAFIITAGHLGRLLLNGDDNGRVLPLLLGLVILFVLTSVPLLGGAIRLIAIITGLGLILRWLHGLWIARAA